MKKTLLAVNLLLLLLTACKKDIPYVSPENSLLSFKIAAAKNLEQVVNDVDFLIGDTLVVGASGNTNSRASLVADFTSSGVAVTVNGVEQVSGVTVNDFTNPVTYVVTAENGTQRKYLVQLKALTGLPILYIKTDAPVNSKDDYVNGTLKIDGNFDFTEGLYDGKIEIRGRGNSTWYQEKKPYKIKLASKSKILGMPSDKEWALLANYFDKTLMRNDVAFELSERLKLAWTPRRRFVEVIMNGNFIGNYLLCETVKIGKDRLNIEAMDTKGATDTLGGFLAEANFRMDGDQNWTTPSGVRMSMTEPGIVSPYQLSYIQAKFLRFENAISERNDIRSELEIDSWVKWAIVNEVMRNRDAILFGSCYFYKDKTQKISMGPVWDFDLSSGGYLGNDAEGWYVNTANWVGWLVSHPYYKQRFKEIWTENFSAISSINNYIKGNERKLSLSEKENFARWNMLAISTFEGQLFSGNYKTDLDAFSGFLNKRIAWMNSEISTW